MEEEAEVNESILVNNEGEEKEQESSVTLKESILLDKEDEGDGNGESRILGNESILMAPKPGSEQKRLSFDSKAKRIQPSCSLASMIQQKLAHEPLVLTRCKSAPMRVAPAKLGVGV
ncbi:hypothetical protein SASPL_139287 [Salvia splendens]|uniref:Uncharacterized protein n=1 Tax=Salvia splendens TaxID=180675 RepID=A0A8X8WMN5_SALSN|nr:hypothetical protein SASPL_139287 [Salvia splendens]